jgi:hypothetical protein
MKAATDRSMKVLEYKKIDNNDNAGNNSDDPVLEYTVLGSKGITYSVKIDNKFSCTCPDFERHNRICKHIYLIFFKVFKIIPDFDTNIINSFQKKLIIKAHDKWVSNNNTDITDKTDVRSRDCTICLECVSESEKIFACTVCKNGFHYECIKICLMHKKTCPLCRSNITLDPKEVPKDSKELGIFV